MKRHTGHTSTWAHPPRKRTRVPTLARLALMQIAAVMVGLMIGLYRLIF